MEIEVELQTRARFGKRDGAHDYSWLAGEDAVPPALAPVCEALGRAASNAGSFISLVARDGDSLWLVRAYSSGMDNAFRPTAAVEVAEVLAPRPLPLREWLGLAVISIQQPARERIGEAPAFRISVPAPQAEPPAPDAALLARARLGLPLATTTRGALSLVGVAPWRYHGICFALRGRGAAPVDWVQELAPFLCVNFTEPPLSAGEAEVLRLALGRDITSGEWGQLRRLGTRELRVALRWASGGEAGPLPVESAEDPLVDWLVAYRGASYRGAQLLARLRRDLPSGPLPPAGVEAATRDLSPHAADFVSRVARGERPELTLEVAEDLAAADFLVDETVAPLNLWAGLARHSRPVAAQALRRFLALGVERAAASFALDLDGEAPAPVSVDSVIEAARAALRAGLPAPKGRLLRALGGATAESHLRGLREVGAVYGGWAEALTRLADEGSLPPVGLLSAPEILAAVRARSSALGLRDALWQALAALAVEGRAAEAADLFNAAESAPPLHADEAARGVIASRLGLGPPAPPPPLADLQRLARVDLARPEDLLLGEADAPNLAQYARLWPQTEPLAGLFGGAGADTADVPSAPASWAVALRCAFTPSQGAEWLARLDPERRAAGRRWLAGMLGLEPGLLETMSGEASVRLEREKVLANLDWLSALMSSMPHARRLEGLAGASRSGVAAGDESFAGQLVSLLLPSADGQAREFALHALSGVGPMPPPAGVPADLAVAVLPALDVAAFVDAVFASRETVLSSDADFCRALAERAEHSGVACPARGYTAEQRRRHLPLACALARVPGWEPLAPDAAARAAHVLRLMTRLDLRPDDLCNAARAAEPEPLPEPQRGPAKGGL